MSVPRDPLDNPREGDVVEKISPKGQKLRRQVMNRRVSEVYYVDLRNGNTTGKVRNCWITTWQKWCEGATVLSASDK